MATILKGLPMPVIAENNGKISDVTRSRVDVLLKQNFENVVPEELKSLKQWINWKPEEKDGRMQKIPCDRHGNPVNCFRQENQQSFSEALSSAKSKKLGIGFVFGNGISGVDIDHCIDEDGELSGSAFSAVRMLDSYTEVSPGGDGLHIIVKGDLPEIAGEKKKYRGGKSGDYEAYSEGRYFTFTGNIYGDRKKLNKRSKELEWFWNKFVGKSSPGNELHSKSKRTESVNKVIFRIENSEDGFEFQTLMNGDFSKYKSQSEADLRLACILAKYCESDFALIKKVFDKSEFGKRDKWKRKDYSQRTIRRAIEAVESSSESSTFEVYSAAELEKRDIPEMKWVIPELIPEGLSILAGKPKVGKSWLALKMGLAIATGRKFWGKKISRGKVLYLALEDGERRLKSRLTKLLDGKAFPANLLFADSSQFKAISGGLMKKLANFLDLHKDVKFVVIDIIAKVSSYKKRNESQYQQEYGFMSLLQALCTERGIGVLAIAHLRKADSEDPFDCISGTLGITGACDTIFVLKSSNTKDLSAVLHVIGREVVESKIPLKFNDGIWTKLNGDEEFYGLSSIRRKIINHLRAEKESSPQNIAETLNLSQGNVRKTLGEMVKGGQVVKMGHGVYSLPEKYK